VSAAIVAVLALLGIPVAFQIIAFGLLGVGTLVLTRPALLRIAGSDTPAVPSGVDAMRGRIGVVTTAIGELEPGQVKLGGETWSARSYFEHEPIALGTRIEVVEIKGVTALVIAAPDDRTELPKET
jgi:membrane protein implicated in regulation of membrane protease activity